MRGWAAQCRLHPAADPRTADARDRLAAALRARVLVSTPREDIGASMLIAEELEQLDVPVEVVPMEELEACWRTPATACGDQPLFPSTGGRAGQEAQRSRSGS